MSDSTSFVASLNHELRNPLNAVVGLTDLALLTTLTGEQSQYLTIIKSAAASLERILNEVSQYGELERLAGAPFPDDVAPCAPCELVDEAVARWRDQATTAGVPLVIRCAPSVPATIRSHPQRLAQLLDCLLGHALQHTQQGEIELRLSATSANSQALQLVVRDTGPTVAPESLGQLFVPFSKVRRVVDRSQGSVLSLPMAALLVRGLRGEIHASSPAGGGLEIACTLPTGEREAVACANI